MVDSFLRDRSAVHQNVIKKSFYEVYERVNVFKICKTWSQIEIALNLQIFLTLQLERQAIIWAIQLLNPTHGHVLGLSPIAHEIHDPDR
jgi:hypothetical protein